MYGNLRDWILLSIDTNVWDGPDVWYAAEEYVVDEYGSEQTWRERQFQRRTWIGG
jgi:hypothetical protein